ATGCAADGAVPQDRSHGRGPHGTERLRGEELQVEMTSELGCRDCGLVQRVPTIPSRHVVECTRCGRVLLTRSVGRVDLPLVLAMCALLLLLAAALAPQLSVSTLGAERQSGMLTGIREFAAQGFPELGALVLICAVVLPFVFLSALVWVLASVH